MSNEAIETFNVKGLDQILKALKAKPPVARVGILGASASAIHGEGPSTVGEIGATHEFGSVKKNIAQRSFLRVPITERLQKQMESSNQFDEDKMKDVIKSGSVLIWLKEIAGLAVEVVEQAFDTGGFGAWPGWKNPSYTNNTGMLLKDTQQLSRSITSEVK